MERRTENKSRSRNGSSATKRIVQPRIDGNWEVVAPKAKRASAVLSTQAKAERRAKQIVRNEGGGEVVVKDQRGRIRDSDTVAPGNDPSPPRDTRH
jgi:hypothetical protein